MAKLTTRQRKKLPKADFAVPGKRAYPVDTPARARNALARVSAYGTPAEKKAVQAKVKKKYPGIAVGGKSQQKSTKKKG